MILEVFLSLQSGSINLNLVFGEAFTPFQAFILRKTVSLSSLFTKQRSLGFSVYLDHNLIANRSLAMTVSL